MKHTILSVIIGLNLLSGALISQGVQAVSQHSMDNRESLEKVLEKIISKKSIHILFESSLVQDRYVTLPIDFGQDAQAVLSDALLHQPIGFKKLDPVNYVLVQKSIPIGKASDDPTVELAPALNPLPPEIPDREIQGTVLDGVSGEPLIGVTVTVKGNPGMGSVTDVDGNYSISVPDEADTLVFSYIGYQTREVSIASGGTAQVILSIGVNQLDEVVITAVGIEANKRALGYSISELKSEDLQDANEANLVSALSGKTAGVLVTSASGSPGSSANIRIRGNKSINGSNKPLIIVDGLPIDNTSSGNGSVGVDVSNRAIDINPNDIESVSILKGPAATAMYGIRAANGALVITTKKGKLGKPVINFRSSFGISEVNKTIDRQFIYAQGTYTGGAAVYRGPETGEANSFGPRMSALEYDGDPTYLYDKHGRLVPAGAGNGMAAIVFDPEADFFDRGSTYDNNISVSGGTERLRYYTSLGTLQQNGVVPTSTWSRYSFKGNFDISLNDKFTVTTNTSVVRSGGDRKNRGNALSGVTIGLFRTPISFDNGNGLRGMDAANYPAAYIFPDGTQRAYRGTDRYDNPYWSINRVPFTDDVNRVLQSVGLKYQIVDGLTFSYKVGMDHYSDKRNAAWDIHSGSEVNGRVEYRTILSTDFNSDLLLSYDHQLGKDFDINATVGHNVYSSNYNTRNTNGLELTKQGFFHISNAINIESNETIARRRLYGVFGDVKLGWHKIAYLNFTGRNDWSSTLPIQNNSFFYPTVSAGLEFTELLGITDHPVLSYGKIRASYGQVGNDAGLYLTENYFQQATADGDNLLPANDFPAFGTNAFERSTVLGNADLKAEKTTTFEIGTDLKLLKGRINLDFTYYKAITSDLIVEAQVSAASGFTIAPVNAGEILNEGVEVVLGLTPYKKGDFRWDMDINFTKAKNIVTALPEGIDQIPLATFSALSSLIVEGEPYGVLVGTAYKRNDAGQLIIGADGWPLVNTEQIKVGDPNPEWIGGLRNSLTYKGWALTGLLDVRKGGDIWNGTKGVLDYLGVGGESGRDREVTGFIYEGVTESGEANTVPVDFANPANGTGGIKWRRNGFLGLAEDNIEDGGWVRLRELALHYTLPQKWFTSWHIDGVNLGISGRNLWLKTDYSGVDPETNLRGDSNDTGWDYFNLPNTRSFTFSLNLKF
ncbi:MAG: SusC/RagA family TonB-linked outer membrane protein [Saprospiraceae bacterium]|nr:SusC/RagA family TonB-linked outer membrane protein [Saprospiraceae bacterium]